MIVLKNCYSLEVLKILFQMRFKKTFSTIQKFENSIPVYNFEICYSIQYLKHCPNNQDFKNMCNNLKI